MGGREWPDADVVADRASFAPEYLTKKILRVVRREGEKRSTLFSMSQRPDVEFGKGKSGRFR